MKSTKVGIVWCALILSVMGCVHTPRETDSPPPLPDVKAVQEDTFSGHDRIVANGVDEYIATYHDAGWLRALGDARVIGASNPSADQSTKSIGNGQSVFYYPLRVKDVFCYYYLRHQGGRSVGHWKSNATWDERDDLIAVVVAEINQGRTAK